MGMFIRDDGVRELAARLAGQERCTITDAVRGALQEKLDRKSRERDEKIRRTLEIVESLKGVPDLRPGFTDKDLYDEEGSPIL